MNERGFMLVEVSISYVILMLAVASLVPTFIMALKANKQTEKIQLAAVLSAELLEEITMRRWDENTSTPSTYTAAPSPTLGLDSGETAGSKATFDDVDDFSGYSEAGVRDPMGGVVAGLTAYTRTVTIAYVDASLAAAGGTTDRKRVDVCTRAPGLNDICLNTIMVNR